MPIINTVISGGNNNDGHYINLEPDSNGKLIVGNSPVNLGGIKDLSNSILEYCRRNSNYTGELFINAEELTQITGTEALKGCANGSRITSLSLPNLVTISGENVFSRYVYQDIYDQLGFYNSQLRTVNLPKLTTVGSNGLAYAFSKANELTTVVLNSLTTVGANGLSNCFWGCTSLISIYLPKLTSEDQTGRMSKTTYMFRDSGLQIFDMRNFRICGDYGILDNMLNGALYLTTVNLNSLEHIGTEGARATFYLSSASSALSEIKFPMLTTFGTNPFYTNAFTGRNGLTIHFRKDAQATVEALANYSTMWGAGTGSSVVFDLVGTLTGADSNAYTRSEINSVYASETAGAAKTATGWKYNDTVYYTSGGTEPVVGDTIYSDAACTTAVTTISAIA